MTSPLLVTARPRPSLDELAAARRRGRASRRDVAPDAAGRAARPGAAAPLVLRRRRPGRASWSPPGPAARARRPRRGVGAGAATSCSATRCAVGAESVVELPRSAPGWSPSCSPTSATAGRGDGRAGRRHRRLRRRRRDDVRLRARPGRGPTRAPPLVVDADPLGPGVDRVLGLDERRRRPVGRARPRRTGRLSARSLREALPRRDGLGVLTWYAGRSGRLAGRSPSARRCRPRARPRHRGGRPAARRRPAGRRGGRAVRPLLVLVVVPTVAGVAVGGPAGAPRSADPGRAAAGGPRQRGRRRAESAAVTGVPVLATMADQRGLAEAIDLGLGPVRSRRGPLGRPRRRELLAGLGAAARRGMTRSPRSSPAVVDRVRERLADRPGDADPAPGRRGAARGRAGRSGDATVLAVHEALRRDVVGAGPLEPLLRLPGVTDVLVNGPDQVYVDRGDGLRARPASGSPTTTSVRRLAQRLAALGGRRLDDAAPYVDLRLPDGTRFHAVLAPVARPGTADLAAGAAGAGPSPSTSWSRPGTLTPARRRAAAGAGRGAGLAFLVSGGTGTRQDDAARRPALPGRPGRAARARRGRLRAAARPPARASALEARPRQRRGRRARSTVRTLVRQALRMRPDRLVVGEVRGAEVVDLLAALNTGHEGGCGTLHANSAVDVPARIEALALAAGLDRAAAHSQLASAVDVVLHLGARPRRRPPAAPRSRCPDAAPTGWSRWSRPSTLGRRRRAGAGPARRPARAVLGPMTVLAVLRRAGCRGRRWRSWLRCGRGSPAGRRRPGRLAPALVLRRGRRRRPRASGCRRGWLVLAVVGAAALRRRAGCSGGAAASARSAQATGGRVLETCEQLAAELAAGQPPGAALDAGRGRLAGARARSPRRSGSAPTCRPRCARVAQPARAPTTCGCSPPPGRSPTAPARAWPTPSTGWRRQLRRRPRPPAAWSTASSPPPGRPRAWSRCCRWSPWRWGRAPAATRSASCSARPSGWLCLAGGLAFGLAGLWWIEALARDVGPRLVSGPAWLAAAARRPRRRRCWCPARPRARGAAGRSGRPGAASIATGSRRWRPLWALLAGAAAAAFLGGPVGLARGAGRARSRPGWSSAAPSPPQVRRDRVSWRVATCRTWSGCSPPRCGRASRPTTRSRWSAGALPGSGRRPAGRGRAAAARSGVDPAQVWADLAADPALGPLGRALARAHRTGAPVVPAVERLADELARRPAPRSRTGPGRSGSRPPCRSACACCPAFVLIGIVPGRRRTARQPRALVTVDRPARLVHSRRRRGRLSTARSRRGARRRARAAQSSSPRPHRGHVPEGGPCTATDPSRSATSAASPPPSTPSAPPPAPGSPGCSTSCSPAASATSCSNAALRPRPRPARHRVTRACAGSARSAARPPPSWRWCCRCWSPSPIGLVWLLAVGAAQVRMVDAARETARALARGDDRRPPSGAGLEVAPDGQPRHGQPRRRRGARDRDRPGRRAPAGCSRTCPSPRLRAEAVAADEEDAVTP